MAADVAETVWYSEDSASPITVSKPAAFASGQILIAVIVQHNNPSAQTDLTTPTGWTFQGALDGTLSDGKVFSYVFTGSDPATWDFPYRSTADVCLGLFRITGADTTPTIVVASTPTGAVTSPIDSPTVTPTGSDDLLICLLANHGNGTVFSETDPSGMTDLGQVQVAGNFFAMAAAKEQLASSSPTGVRTWTSVSPTGNTGGTLSIAVKSTAAVAAIPFNPQRATQVRDPGEVQWLQRDRRDANTVATTANPLPSPLDSSYSAGGRYWHLRGDAADAAPRTWQSLQRNYTSDPSLLVPPPAMPAPSPTRTVPARDYGEAQWLQPPRRDQITTALLENEFLGGADTIRHQPGSAHLPRWWMPQQRAYISDPSFYPTTTSTDPLTLAFGAGGTYWLLYNTAALQIDRREVPQQRRYQSDPGAEAPPAVKADSTPTVSAGRTSTAAVAAGRTSTAAVTAKRTSSGGVS